MYSLEIEIPILETDPNRTKGRHWTKTSANNQKIKTWVNLETTGKRPEMPLENFKLSITRHGSRCLDYDNLIASFKGYIDALKHAGIIIDDSWKYLKQINTDQKISTEKKLVIRVDETGFDQAK